MMINIIPQSISPRGQIKFTEIIGNDTDTATAERIFLVYVQPWPIQMMIFAPLDWVLDWVEDENRS